MKAIDVGADVGASKTIASKQITESIIDEYSDSKKNQVIESVIRNIRKEYNMHEEKEIDLSAVNNKIADSLFGGTCYTIPSTSTNFSFTYDPQTCTDFLPYIFSDLEIFTIAWILYCGHAIKISRPTSTFYSIDLDRLYHSILFTTLSSAVPSTSFLEKPKWFL
jgi:hypothetical protein